MTGDIFDFGDKVRAVRKGDSYLTLAAFCESYYAHFRCSLAMLQRHLKDFLPGRKSIAGYMWRLGLSRTYWQQRKLGLNKGVF